MFDCGIDSILSSCDHIKTSPLNVSLWHFPIVPGRTMSAFEWYLTQNGWHQSGFSNDCPDTFQHHISQLISRWSDFAQRQHSISFQSSGQVWLLITRVCRPSVDIFGLPVLCLHSEECSQDEVDHFSCFIPPTPPPSLYDPTSLHCLQPIALVQQCQ